MFVPMATEFKVDLNGLEYCGKIKTIVLFIKKEIG